MPKIAKSLIEHGLMTGFVCIIFIIFATAIPMADLASGLVAYWPLDGNAEEVVGGIDVEVLGDPKWLSGQDAWIGAGTLFCDGVDDHILAGDFNPSEGTGELTVALWTTLNEHKETMFLKKGDDWSENNMMWQFEMDVNGDLSIGRDGSAPWFGVKMPLEEWTHLAVTVADDKATLYINGESMGDGGFIMGTGTESTLRIGATQTPHRFVDGMMDEILLYDRAIEPEEVKELAGGVGKNIILAVEPKGKLSRTWASIKESR